MKLIKGKLYLEKIDHDRVKVGDDGREYLELIVMINDGVDDKGKIGVIQQATEGRAADIPEQFVRVGSGIFIKFEDLNKKESSNE